MKEQTERQKRLSVIISICAICVLFPLISSCVKSESPLEKEKQAFQERQKSAMKKEPANAEDYKDRGDACMAKGDTGQAISEYTKAIEVNPNDGEAYNNRAVMYFGEKEYAKAKEDVSKAQALGYTVSSQLLENLNRESTRSPEYQTLDKGGLYSDKTDPALLGKLKQSSADASQPGNNSAEIESPNIALDGIFVDANGKYKAMINGSTVSEGSDIGGVKIDKINKDSVDVIVNGQKKNVLVGQGKGSPAKATEAPQKTSVNIDNANTKVYSKEHYNSVKELFNLGLSQIKGVIKAKADYALLYSYEQKGPKGDEKRETAIKAMEDELDTYVKEEREAQLSLEGEQLTESEHNEMTAAIATSQQIQSEIKEEIRRFKE